MNKHLVHNIHNLIRGFRADEIAQMNQMYFVVNCMKKKSNIKILLLLYLDERSK